MKWISRVHIFSTTIRFDFSHVIFENTVMAYMHIELLRLTTGKNYKYFLEKLIYVPATKSTGAKGVDLSLSK